MDETEGSGEMDGDLLVGLFFCLVVPGLVVWAVVANRRRDRPYPAAPPIHRAHAAVDTEAARVAWLLHELDRAEIRNMLPPEVRARLAAHYRARLGPATATATAPAAVPPAATAATELAAIAPAPLSAAPAVASPITPSALFAPLPEAARPIPAAGPASTIGASATIRKSVAAPAVAPPPPAPPVPAEPRPRPWESWDSAVVLLYLGAFLVVAAGLVYSSYNWSDLPGWQKVGMLMAATVGFGGGGFALLRVARVRPAAETFVAIGAFLTPMNVLAARNFLEGGGDGSALGPFATLEFGALLVAALYGVFSYRPGGLVYRYATAAALLVAVFALPPALGAHWAWGAVLTAFATALIPDAPRRLGGRLRRFAGPAVEAGLVALPLATSAAIAAALSDGPDWAAPAALTAASLTVGRLAVRRNFDVLAWLWTALVAATVVAALLAGQRPAADWAPAAVALAAAWLVLGDRGPGLLRRLPNRDVLHAEALALFSLAPVFAAAGNEWALLSLTGAAGTAGCAALARSRREPLLAGLAALATTGTYLSLGNVVPDRVLEVPRALLLAPCALGLALVGAVVGSRLGGRRGRRWALPVWAIAGLDAVAVTLVALGSVADGAGGTTETLALAAVAAAFGVTALGAARSLRLPDALLTAAGWIELAAVAALAALPAGVDRTLPTVVLANLVLCSAALGLPFARWTIAGAAGLARQRRAAAGFALCGGLALLIMVVLTFVYAGDLRRPPTNTAHPETGWWWPYLGAYLLLAAIAVALGRWRDTQTALRLPALPDLPDRFAAFAAGALGAAALLGLRMTYAALDLAPETWFAALTVAGGLVGAAGLTWRAAADLRFDRVLAAGVAVLGLAFGGPALALMVTRAGRYALDLTRRTGGDPLPDWWWLYLAVFGGLLAGGRWLGRRLAEPLLAPLAAVGLLGVESLVLRAAYGNGRFAFDQEYWLPIAATAGALTVGAAWWLALRGGRPFDRDLAGWATGVGLLVGAPALIGMLTATAAHVLTLDEPTTVAAWGETGWWWAFLGWYAVTAALLLVGGSLVVRRRLVADRPVTVLAQSATVAAGVAIAQAWRIGYGLLPLDRLDWLALAVPLGLAIAGAGHLLREHGLTLRGRRSDAFAGAVGRNLGSAGIVLAAAAQLGATILTLLVIFAPADGALPHAGDPAFWWRYLALHLAVAAGAWGWGRAGGSAVAGPLAVGYGALTLWLGVRMATTDLAVWSVVGLAATAGCYALWTIGRGWATGTPFETALREAVAAAGVLLGAISLPANLAFGWAGEIAAGVEAVVYLALGLGVFAAGLREREPCLGYGAAGSLVAAIAFAVAAAGIAPVNAGYAYAALGWALLGGSLALPAAGLFAGQRPVWERAGYACGALPILLGLTQSGALEPGTTAYGRLTLAAASLAGLLFVGALTGPRGRRTIQGYAAATLGLGALLMQIAAAEPANIQAYTVPVAFYLLGLAWTRRRDSLAFDVLVGGGAALLMVPSFLQSFGGGGFAWAMLCGAEGLLFVFAGLGIGRRVPVATGIVAITVVALRQTLDYVNSLPTWAIMALVGVLLLILGTLSLIARDAFLRRLETGRERWSDLR